MKLALFCHGVVLVITIFFIIRNEIVFRIRNRWIDFVFYYCCLHRKNGIALRTIVNKIGSYQSMMYKKLTCWKLTDFLPIDDPIIVEILKINNYKGIK